MASASSTSARSLFVESKMRLADRVQVNVNNIASLARQIQRGSKSSEVRTISSLFRSNFYFRVVYHSDGLVLVKSVVRFEGKYLLTRYLLISE